MLSVCLKRLGRKQHNCSKQGKQIRLLPMLVDSVADTVGTDQEQNVLVLEAWKMRWENRDAWFYMMSLPERQLRDLAGGG